ncbi:uncharacterized protein F5891DRAFT_1192073 [Suillus fuscotomentosus]|uniref:C2H2-type domain-containing protein n=1 Tax=Suillus fuscotomentosus TaxID=1912939 RepID=A0AAD4HI51_9AGAM|nr:uncharacterized protein F5891DRAFT_1192073 [Suillus fuscotomentosus]KAG1897357.1 hypothetical protein F5891DRAFT_1192073 [Suillus fuscotomentosus]
MNSLRVHHRKRHERTIDSSRSILQNPSSSWPGQAPDQHSTRLVRQSCLQCLDRLDKLERRVHEEIQEIRSLFKNVLENDESDVTMENSGEYDTIIDSQARLDGFHAIPPFASSHKHGFVPQPVFNGTSFGVTGSLLEGTGSPEGLLPHGTRSFADYVAPQYSMYSEGFPTFGDPRVAKSSSESVDARLDSSPRGTSDSVYKPAARLFAPVVQASQAKDKVKCTRDGCSTLVNKDNLTRHINEVHEGKIKAVCPGCRQGFKRPNLMKEHILRTGCGRS